MENTLFSQRILFLNGEVNQESAITLVKELILLNAMDPVTPIDLYINSQGGEVNSGLALIDAMQCIQAPVHTICIGTAASMGAWILAAGEKGYRRSTPHAEIMIHQMASGVHGQTTYIQTYVDHMVRQQQQMIKMFSQWTGKPESQIVKDIQVERFMNAVEARAYGIIDEIIQPCKLHGGVAV